MSVNLRNITAAIALFFALISISSIALAQETVSSGAFSGASGHVTKGTASVVKNGSELEVLLGADFDFDGAPDPKVGFGKNGKYDSKSQLAHLQSNKGKQRYQIPADLDVSGYNEIYIWCEAYAVPLGVAKIK